MAMNMTAAVNIKASVDGLQSIAGLQKGLAGVDAQAKKTNQSFGGLRQAAGGVVSNLRGLVPAATIAGVAALGKNAIDTADNLNDLSKRTGVSVENLDKFGKAARDNGSSLEEVAKGMGKLAKGISDPASKVSESLKSIGVSTRDARGNLLSVDKVMLQVADRFSKMPDGVQKTALAMEIFGKSGANLIPMLNEGSAALGKYQATITTDMARAADQFNDTLNKLAAALAGPFNKAITALLPTLTTMANALAEMVKAFTALPEPIQGLIIGLAGLLLAINTLTGPITLLVNGLKFIAGLKLGATIAGWAPVLVQIGQAFLVLGRIVLGFFTGPVGWVALLIAAGIAIYTFRDRIFEAFKAIGGFIGQVFQSIGGILKRGAEAFYGFFVKPVLNFGKTLIDGIKSVFSKFGEIVTAPFRFAVDVVKGIFRNLLQIISNGVNAAIGVINRLISAYNKLPTPDIPLVPQVSVPAFAEGGTVNRPTFAMVGEGGQREYIIPESKMARASANYLAGTRGDAVLTNGRASAASPTIQIQTGPVIQQDGQRWVTVRDMEKAMVNLADALLSNGRTPGGRRYQGVGA